MIINYCTLANENLASFRYSMLIPAMELKKRGHRIVVSPHPFKDADVGVFNKHLNYEEINYLKWFKEKGKKTVFHVCDDHFDTKHNDHYRRMIGEADVVTVTTKPLQDVVKEKTGRDSVLIQDPYYYQEKEAQYNPGDKLRVLWFGHQTNADSLLPYLNYLDRFVDFTIVSSIIAEKILRRPVIPWSIDTVPMEIANCDVVIIPSLNTPRKLVKSNNRMLESIRCGRFVISDPLPCYEEFRETMMVDGIKEGFEWLALQPKNAILDRIKKAQEYIREKYSPAVSADSWEKMLCA